MGFESRITYTQLCCKIIAFFVHKIGQLILFCFRHNWITRLPGSQTVNKAILRFDTWIITVIFSFRFASKSISRFSSSRIRSSFWFSILRREVSSSFCLSLYNCTSFSSSFKLVSLISFSFSATHFSFSLICIWFASICFKYTEVFALNILSWCSFFFYICKMRLRLRLPVIRLSTAPIYKFLMVRVFSKRISVFSF